MIEGVNFQVPVSGAPAQGRGAPARKDGEESSAASEGNAFAEMLAGGAAAQAPVAPVTPQSGQVPVPVETSPGGQPQTAALPEAPAATKAKTLQNSNPVTAEALSLGGAGAGASAIQSRLGGVNPWDSAWIRGGGVPEQIQVGRQPALEAAPNPTTPSTTPPGALPGAAPQAAVPAPAAALPLLAGMRNLGAPPAAQTLKPQAAGGAQGKAVGTPAASLAGTPAQGQAELASLMQSAGLAASSGAQWAEMGSDEESAELPPAAQAPVRLAPGLSGEEFLNTRRALESPVSGAGALAAMQGASPSAAAARVQPGQAAPTPMPAHLVTKPQIPTGSQVLERRARNAVGSEGELAASAGAAAGTHAAARPLESPPQQITAQVVPGAMARERLATASVGTISSGIGSLKERGGGEIRLRLNPEHLGEIHLRVATHGNEVAIQVRASNDKAKGVLEESLSALKESLAGHRLVLGKVEILGGVSADATLGTGGTQQNTLDASTDQRGNLAQNMAREWGGGGDRRGSGREAPADRAEPSGLARAAIPGAISTRGSAAVGATGRLNVLA
ncbi:MAG: flagellar hook-length control protein FliK [Bdellovibrionales bacterium]|nr:flagellar hook-length control protein FliK [Bdellovibrionales bacterium]